MPFTPTATREDTARLIDAMIAADEASASLTDVGSGIRDHDEVFAAKPKTMSHAELARIATAAADEERQYETYTRNYRYQTWDVALAFARICRDRFGHEPFTVENRVRSVELPVGPHDTVTVAYGVTTMPELNATITHDSMPDDDLGQVGLVSIHAPKKMLPAVRTLCRWVEEDLAKNSIYKGRCITSDPMPKFLDPWVTNAEHIVWDTQTDAALRGSLLNVIAYPERAKARGLSIHRSTLLYGKPGNGKSETINVIAQQCAAFGFTYILATTTLKAALQMARQYAPAVVAFEDFERIVNEATPEERSELLEELDGTTSKGHDVMLVATTNFIDKLPRSIRRRMFKEIEFGPLDIASVAKLLKIRIAEDDGGVDYFAVAEQMDGWGNVFITKVVDFAAGISLGHESPLLTTDDLLSSVAAVTPEWEGYKASFDELHPPALETALKEVMTDAISEGKLATNGDGALHFVKG